jgi:hypothetical protein
MTTPGIDASVELSAALDALSSTNSLAAAAPRSADIYRYLADGMRSGSRREEFFSLTMGLIEDLSIWWSPEAYETMPVLVPWCVRDRSCRYDQGPESWGSPRDDGYLRDDNSIIKKLPLPLLVNAPGKSRYNGRKPLRGFTACHIWRDLPDGALAGADPWLYSFVPNLVWLPRWIAPLSDLQGSGTQLVLQRTAISMFKDRHLPEKVRDYALHAWRRLPPPLPGFTLSIARLATFETNQSFFTRRINYLEKFVSGCDQVLCGRPLTQKLICSRYTAELPQVSRDELSRFRNSIDEYRKACSV